MLAFIFFLFLSLGLLMLIANWKVFTKAGKPGWASIVPIYNTMIMLEIVGKPWWWIFLLLIPGVNLIFAIWLLNLLSKSFGQNEGFTIGLLFLPMIFWPVLGFGSSQYQGPAAAPRQE